jgi:hypothetical protein
MSPKALTARFISQLMIFIRTWYDVHAFEKAAISLVPSRPFDLERTRPSFERCRKSSEEFGWCANFQARSLGHGFCEVLRVMRK